MNKAIKSFFRLNTWMHLVVCLCLLGVLINACSIMRDLRYDSILLKLHFGFLVLYFFQIVFIFLREKWVALLTILQGFMALYTNSDFTFVPVLRVLGKIYLTLFTVSVEGLEVYKYVFVSLAFTVQMYTAYTLFVSLRSKPSKNPMPSTTITNA